jgi:rhodanese-related sulfurtransferase
MGNSSRGSIAPAALMEQITAGTAPVILDVRSKREFDAGHLPGAVHLPFWRVGLRWRAHNWTADQPIVV